MIPLCWLREHTLRARIWRRLLENKHQSVQYGTVVCKKWTSSQCSAHTAMHDLACGLPVPPRFSDFSSCSPPYSPHSSYRSLTGLSHPNTLLPQTLCTPVSWAQKCSSPRHTCGQLLPLPSTFCSNVFKRNLPWPPDFKLKPTSCPMYPHPSFPGLHVFTSQHY